MYKYIYNLFVQTLILADLNISWYIYIQYEILFEADSEIWKAPNPSAYELKAHCILGGDKSLNIRIKVQKIIHNVCVTFVSTFDILFQVLLLIYIFK